ncbi:MAG: YHYH protein [Bdellovibrionales bacterium]|nr:YHYH protein [Bdellovibrionales bacterium]
MSGLGDLDECNGRFSITPEFPDGIYHYFITSEFPFIPRSYRGTPDSSFAHNLPGPGAVPPALRSFGR